MVLSRTALLFAQVLQQTALLFAHVLQKTALLFAEVLQKTDLLFVEVLQRTALLLAQVLKRQLFSLHRYSERWRTVQYSILDHEPDLKSENRHPSTQTVHLLLGSASVLFFIGTSTL
jgi:hypothetical protein